MRKVSRARFFRIVKYAFTKTKYYKFAKELYESKAEVFLHLPPLFRGSQREDLEYGTYVFNRLYRLIDKYRIHFKQNNEDNYIELIENGKCIKCYYGINSSTYENIYWFLLTEYVKKEEEKSISKITLPVIIDPYTTSLKYGYDDSKMLKIKA